MRSKNLILVRAISILSLLAVMGLSGPAWAQSDAMRARLSAEKMSDVEAGLYSAGDSLNFTLAPYADRYLLRFSDGPEAYVLTVERVLLGGRILRYDTGAVALRVSVWGGLTLYTSATPGGLPATKTGEEIAPPAPPVSHNDLTAAMVDEGNHLAYTSKVRLRFLVETAILNGSDDNRRLAFDAMVSAEAGIERLLAAPGGREAFTSRFNTIRLVQGDKPGLAAAGKTLVISYAPDAGVAGHASSREVAMLLGKVLQIAEAG